LKKRKEKKHAGEKGRNILSNVNTRGKKGGTTHEGKKVRVPSLKKKKALHKKPSD